ncbi:MAG: hypothetical protein ABI587_14240 [Gemmatimonadales bacterium]
MQAVIRRRLDRIDRVFGFSQQHLTEVKGYVAAVTQLGEQLKRVQVLTTQSEAGDLTEDASTALKTELRRVIEEDHLAHFVRIAHSVTPSDPELKKRFRMPERKVSLQAFLPAARALAAEAASRKELLIGEGLPETFLEDLNTALDGYAEAVNQQDIGRASHVGARAELRALTKEMGLLVRRLDSINRYRFRNNAELLAAWNSVRSMSWPSTEKPGSAGGTAAA